jgi:hypothetical protein
MRLTYSFSEAVVEAIAHDRYHHPDPRVQERMEILWLKSRDEPHGRIAELADVSRSTVQRTLRIYLAGGLDGIRSTMKPRVGQVSSAGDLRVSFFVVSSSWAVGSAETTAPPDPQSATGRSHVGVRATPSGRTRLFGLRRVHGARVRRPINLYPPRRPFVRPPSGGGPPRVRPDSG